MNIVFISDFFNKQLNGGAENNDSVLRKSLAIGADKAIRINSKATDSFQVASYIANYAKENSIPKEIDVVYYLIHRHQLS